jgi:hypothetical protein
MTLISCSKHPQGARKDEAPPTAQSQRRRKHESKRGVLERRLDAALHTNEISKESRQDLPTDRADACVANHLYKLQIPAGKSGKRPKESRPYACP